MRVAQQFRAVRLLDCEATRHLLFLESRKLLVEIVNWTNAKTRRGFSEGHQSKWKRDLSVCDFILSAQVPA